MTVAGERRVITVPFILVSLVSVVCFTAFQAMQPTLPFFVTRVFGGQQADVGLVMGTHSFGSMLVCMVVGSRMDRFGRKPIALLATAGFAVSYVLLALATSIPMLIAVRLFAGLALGSLVSSLNTMVADLAPPERRGAAMGYYNVISTASMAFGPLLGMALMNGMGFDALFEAAAALSAVSFVIACALPETLPDHRRGRVSSRDSASEERAAAPKVRLADLLRLVRLPGLVMLGMTTTFGALQNFTPIYAAGQGVDNPGVFYTVFAISTLFARLAAGKMSDDYGRRIVVLPGVLIVGVCSAIMASSGTLPTILLVAVLFGIGFGSAQVGLMAFTVDSVDPTVRGAALGYLQASFEIGAGLGSMILGVIGQSFGFQGLFLVASLPPVLGFIVFLLGEPGHRRMVEAGRLGVDLNANRQ